MNRHCGFKHEHFSYTNPYCTPDEVNISCGDAGDDGSVNPNNTTVFILNEVKPSTALGKLMAPEHTIPIAS
jgi:hypothetical protein